MKNAKLEEFSENPADKHKKGLWKAVKNLKGKFTPRFIQMQDREGRLVSLKERAETIADYLEKEHWTNTAENGIARQICLDPICEQENPEEQRNPFSFDELETALSLSKQRKRTWPRFSKNGIPEMA
jgi:hypothetical protein